MNRYFYISPSGDGWRNLATDEYFLNTLGPDDFMLYLYINTRAVIIGRNQNPWRECRLEAMEKDGVQLVRRISGGGAVYHDEGNLNFSFIAGEAHYDLHRQMEIITGAVKALGIPAELSGRNDITADGRKFSGNAFCARGGNKQHHGTLLLHADLSVMQNYLNVSSDKLKSKGVQSVRSRVCNLNEYVPGLTSDSMAAALRDACSAHLGEMSDFVITPEAETEIEKLYGKHSSWEWRMGKSPSFDWSLENRFDWGGIQLCIGVEGGVITDVSLYTDSLDPELSEKAARALVCSRFETMEMVSRLRTAGESRELADMADFIASQEL